MFSAKELLETTRSPQREIEILAPEIDHGADIWRVAKAASELDLNSSYMYLLFARDFAHTCRIAVIDGEVAGFVLAYRRTEDPSCLFVWQVAVDVTYRGEGLARRMLNDLVVSSVFDETPVRTIETTITDDNIASRRLFTDLAERWNTVLKTRALFDESHFPDDHDAERLHLIGPIDPANSTGSTVSTVSVAPLGSAARA